MHTHPPLDTGIDTFFRGLGITIESLEVTQDHESIHIHLKTPDSALIIGMHGKNIDTIRHLLGRIAEKHTGKFFHIHLEINDYMKEKDERLYRFLDKKIALVRSSGNPIPLPHLDAFERKKAHHYIQSLGIEGLMSESE